MQSTKPAVTLVAAGAVAMFMTGCSPERVSPSTPPSSPAPAASVSAPPAASPAPVTYATPTADVRPYTRRLDLGEFAVATEPSAEHPKGTIAALDSQGAGSELQVASVDVATAKEIGRVSLAPATDAMIAPTDRGVVVAITTPKSLSLTWLDDGRTMKVTHTVAGFGTAPGSRRELYGLKTMAGHVIVVDGDSHALVVDGLGNVVAQHTCPGGFFHPGKATMVAWGKRVVVTNLLSESSNDAPKRVACAFRTDGPGPTLTATMGDSRTALFVAGSTLYSRDEQGEVHALGDDLRAHGSVVDASPPMGDEEDMTTRVCPGITGSAVWQREIVHGEWIIRSVSCCGDESPGGLFFCDAT